MTDGKKTTFLIKNACKASNACRACHAWHVCQDAAHELVVCQDGGYVFHVWVYFPARCMDCLMYQVSG